MFKRKNLLFLISMILILTVFVGSTLAVIIVKTDDIMNIFRPQDPTGTLQITKTVQHPFDAAYAIPDNIQFQYRIALGTDMAGTEMDSSNGKVTVAQDGTVVLTAKPASLVELYDVPTGKEVTITEINIPAGFTPQGGAQKVTTIPMRNSVRVDYVNIYEPAKAPVNVTLDGTKELEGRDWMAGDSFTFALSHKKDGAWQELGTKTVAYDAANADFNKFSFTDTLNAFAFDQVGTYSFRISEVKGSIGGIDYENEEKTVSYLDVTVTDADMDGALEISAVKAGKNAQVTETAGSFAVAVTIRNTYAPEGTAQATVRIHKTLNDLSGRGLLPENFTFTLMDASGKVVATSAPTGAAGETTIALTFQAIDAGRQFTYTLQETTDSTKGMTFDSKVYTVTVDVIDNLDGTIRAAIYKTGDAKPYTAVCDAEFVNTYDPEDATVQIAGTKELTGRKLADGEFTFQLYPTEDGINIPEGAVPAQTVNAGKDIKFDAITYDKVGIYRYIVLEDSTAALGGITYDESRFYVTVNVTDEGGTLKAAVSVKDIYGADATILFKNTYSPTKTWLDLTAKKTLEGATLTNDQFTFLVYQANSDWRYDAERPLQVIHNDAEGKIALDRIEFEQSGTWRFVLMEDTRQLANGMTADDSVYGITVVVNDDGKGNLKPYVDIALKTLVDDGQGGTKVEWKKVEEMTFHNIYVEPPTTEPPTTETPTTKPGTDDPETGDDFNLTLFVTLMIVSFIGLVTMITVGVVLKRKEKKEQE